MILATDVHLFSWVSSVALDACSGLRCIAFSIPGDDYVVLFRGIVVRVTSVSRHETVVALAARPGLEVQKT